MVSVLFLVKGLKISILLHEIVTWPFRYLLR